MGVSPNESDGPIDRRPEPSFDGGEAVLEHISRIRDEAGQTMAEYAVVLAVITIAVVVTLGLLSTSISAQLNSVIGVL
jgi:Flp pilus assembly pilin Flp